VAVLIQAGALLKMFAADKLDLEQSALVRLLDGERATFHDASMQPTDPDNAEYAHAFVDGKRSGIFRKGSGDFERVRLSEASIRSRFAGAP